MICPNCRHDIPDSSSSCPQCGTPILHPRVIDAEVVNSSGPEREVKDAQYEAPRQTHFTRVFYTTFPGGNGGGGTLPTSCLPTMITFGLALAVLLKYDLAYAIAFLVFAGIGRGITFFMTIQHWMQGRSVNPWMLHIVTWGICWALIECIRQS